MAKRLKGVPNLPFAPIVSALFGLVAAILVFATPAWLLERTVGALGISSVLAAAQPPLGDTARTLFAIVAGIVTGLALWIIMRPIEKKIHANRVGKKVVRAPAADSAPVAVPVERSTADRLNRTGRAPIFADYDLGAPLMSDEALASGGELLLEQPFVEEPADPMPEEKPLAWDEMAADWTDPVDAPAELVLPEVTNQAPLVLEPPVGWDDVAPVAKDLPLAWDAVQEPVEPKADTWEAVTHNYVTQPAPEDDHGDEFQWSSIAPVAPVATPEPEIEELILEPTMVDEPVTFNVVQPSVTPTEEVMEPVDEAEQAEASYEAKPVDIDLGLSATAFVQPEAYEPVTFDTHPEPESDQDEAPHDLPTPPVEVAEQAQVHDEDGISLTDLLARLEVALDRRAQLERDGQQVSAPPSSGTVASLREMIAGNRKFVG